LLLAAVRARRSTALYPFIQSEELVNFEKYSKQLFESLRLKRGGKMPHMREVYTVNEGACSTEERFLMIAQILNTTQLRFRCYGERAVRNEDMKVRQLLIAAIVRFRTLIVCSK
jgi:hypothetical protein